MKHPSYYLLATVLLFAGCSSDTPAGDDNTTFSPLPEANASLYETDQVFTDVTAMTVKNSYGAYVTSQCYTKTEESDGNVHNPCFTCHVNSVEPNYIDDAALQESYAFSEATYKNPWSNLFVDRTDAVAAVSDAAILAYVRGDNYFDANGSIMLGEILKHVPDAWDYNHDGQWGGFVPDCYFAFDGEGFDRDPGGDYTGWRAFAYYPFPGTFWPTNGSTDDVLIRLPEVMRQTKEGVFDKEVYKLNLAIVEALIKRSDIAIEPVDEKVYGVDLNQNGTLDNTSKVVYRWAAPSYDFETKRFYNYAMYYVGRAQDAQIDNALHMAPGLYPEQTEFLHTVRYLDVDANGSVGMAPRMKELRYGRKSAWNTYPQLSNAAQAEIKDKDAFPNRLRTITGNEETGLNTGLGWVYQGFIEDKEGYLRPQSYEETLFCIGCHSGIGAVVDSTFVFPRKFDGGAKQMGWYHWTQSDSGFQEIKEPVLADGRYEYTLYLEANHAGDEFRGNDEVTARFFDGNGSLIPSEIEALHSDISRLIVPSKARAMMLNKAYRVIVEEQGYIYGRDAHVAPAANVHQQVAVDTPTGIKAVTMERYPLQ
jgi:hypothetical protein